MEYVFLIFGTLILINFGVAEKMSEGRYTKPAAEPDVIIEDAGSSAGSQPLPAPGTVGQG